MPGMTATHPKEAEAAEAAVAAATEAAAAGAHWSPHRRRKTASMSAVDRAAEAFLQKWIPPYLKKTGIAAVDVLTTIDDEDADENPTVEMLERALEAGLPPPRCEEDLLQIQEAVVVVLSHEIAAEGLRENRMVWSKKR